MAKSEKIHTSPAEETAEFPLSIDEFCAELSAHDRRVELISAFASDMRRKGITRATATTFRARLVEFAGSPA